MKGVDQFQMFQAQRTLYVFEICSCYGMMS
jgi:hypothetical protein